MRYEIIITRRDAQEISHSTAGLFEECAYRAGATVHRADNLGERVIIDANFSGQKLFEAFRNIICKMDAYQLNAQAVEERTAVSELEATA